MKEKVYTFAENIEAAKLCLIDLEGKDFDWTYRFGHLHLNVAQKYIDQALKILNRK